MFDLSSCEIPMVTGDATDAVHRRDRRSSCSADDYAFDDYDIDLVDGGLGVVAVDGAFPEDRTRRRRMMACEMSDRSDCDSVNGLVADDVH